MEFVGFLNEYLFTDIKTYKVLKEGKNISVKKLVGNTKTQMDICGHIARLSINTNKKKKNKVQQNSTTY